MPNHWHFVLWPAKDGRLTAFLRWLTHTHTQRWHAHYHTSGTGHLYQGRFKSFPVAEDEHCYRVLRYVERNPLRAGLVRKAENWRWSSLWERTHAGPLASLLSPNRVEKVVDADGTGSGDAVSFSFSLATFGEQDGTIGVCVTGNALGQFCVGVFLQQNAAHKQRVDVVFFWLRQSQGAGRFEDRFG